MKTVHASNQQVTIPTYPLPDADRHPMFFEKRVYQGSSGRVYPLAFYSRLSDEKVDRQWDIWALENDYVRIDLMPELGGRIWRGLDKTNAYDFFYHQSVVKPALVGLAGPWISGGVEFNWPQHHRPATYLPTDVTLEEHDDGSRTVWMSDHDPMSHMKGMHGVTVSPGSSCVDLKVRLYNRTAYKQTFLWWANVAAQVHDQYQSFFPPDVQYVADHAVRAMSSFPVAQNLYYGIDYRPGTDLSWYKNIPVPTSYMITKTSYDFFGGYDHAADGGFVHVADRHTCPGKKQWTWGNHEFGWAWDRELTDADASGNYPPYVELMAGAYTDNQPDFSYLLPYETKMFTQSWWPIRGIGVAHQADRAFALHLSVEGGKARLGLCASSDRPDARLRLTAGGQAIYDESAAVSPDRPVLAEVALPSGCRDQDLRLEVLCNGVVQLAYVPPRLDPDAAIPPSATEPPTPEQVESNDALYLTGEHLEQYRHPTREPEAYWQEAIRRDPGDMRANTAMGRRLLGRGLNEQAAEHLRHAVNRARHRHPNPEDGEALYFLGLTLKRLGQDEEAYRWLYKSTWSFAWRAPGYYQLAAIDTAHGRFDQALSHLDAAQQTNASHSSARTLKAALLRRLGRLDETRAVLDAVLTEDALDHWAGFEKALLIGADDPGASAEARAGWAARCGLRTPTLLDVAFDYTDAGLFDEAAEVLSSAGDNAPAMVGYALGWVYARQGRGAEADEAYSVTKQGDGRWCFPDRWQEERVLRSALAHDGRDAVAGLALGSMLYDKRRYDEAIEAWEAAAESDQASAGVYRNLGIAYYNIRRDEDAARRAYTQAFACAADDAQVLFEYDLLLKLCAEAPERRLERYEAHLSLVGQRDDLSIEYATLLNLVGRHADAERWIDGRRFHPWEGGEGMVLGQHTATQLALGRAALDADRPEEAHAHFDRAMNPPKTLGEARHLLANTAEIHHHLGLACRALGQEEQARANFEDAAATGGDFLEMGVQPFSEKSYDRGVALKELGREDEAQAVFQGMIDHGEVLCQTEAKIDYFATSLPDLLVFDVDLKWRREIEGTVLQALGRLGLGDGSSAARLFDTVLQRDPSHLTACLLRQSLTPS